MATITITKLHCVRKQDVSGDDEPVIRLGGQRAWEGKMGKEVTASSSGFHYEGFYNVA